MSHRRGKTSNQKNISRGGPHPTNQQNISSNPMMPPSNIAITSTSPTDAATESKKKKKSAWSWLFIITRTVWFMVFLSLGSYGIAWWIEMNRIPNIVTRWHSGTLNDFTLPEPFFSRPDLVDTIRTTIQPTKLHGAHSQLIVGPHGCGKSTLIHLAIRENPSGIFYCVCELNGDFPLILGNTIGYNFDSSGSYQSYSQWYNFSVWAQILRFAGGKSAPTMTPYKEVITALEEAAKMYYSNYGSVPVLVVDEINRLATSDPELLINLEHKAKDWKDRRMLNLILISSDGIAPQLLSRQSAFSRFDPSFHIPDITDEEAITFLSQHTSYPKKDIERFVSKVAGGRLLNFEPLLRKESNLNALSTTCSDLIQKARAIMRDFPEIVQHIRNISDPERGALSYKDFKGLDYSQIQKAIEGNLLIETALADYPYRLHSRALETLIFHSVNSIEPLCP